MGKKKQETAEITANQSNFGHEIWGLIFLAISVLLLISLISHFVNKSNNILGYYFGTGLSAGLVFFFWNCSGVYVPIGHWIPWMGTN